MLKPSLQPESQQGTGYLELLKDPYILIAAGKTLVHLLIVLYFYCCNICFTLFSIIKYWFLTIKKLRFGLQCVIVVFPDHTHLLFDAIYCTEKLMDCSNLLMLQIKHTTK